MFEINKKNARFWSMLGMNGACGWALSKLGEQHKDLICMSADLSTTSSFDQFQRKFPERFINTGIAEQNMLGIAAGLALDGHRVFTSTFATFASLRSAEQMRNLAAYMELPVTSVGISSGFTMGPFGNTHYGYEDIAVFRAIPNMVVLSPADAASAVRVTELALENRKPTYLRLSGLQNPNSVYYEDAPFVIGGSNTLRDGEDIAIIATGLMVDVALQSAEKLATKGISTTVVDAYSIKPFDVSGVRKAVAGKQMVLTIEEHNVFGGLRDCVLEALSNCYPDLSFAHIGIGDRFVKPGTHEYLLSSEKLSVDSVVDVVMKSVARL